MVLAFRPGFPLSRKPVSIFYSSGFDEKIQELDKNYMLIYNEKRIAPDSLRGTVRKDLLRITGEVFFLDEESSSKKPARQNPVRFVVCPTGEAGPFRRPFVFTFFLFFVFFCFLAEKLEEELKTTA